MVSVRRVASSNTLRSRRKSFCRNNERLVRGLEIALLVFLGVLSIKQFALLISSSTFASRRNSSTTNDAILPRSSDSTSTPSMSIHMSNLSSSSASSPASNTPLDSVGHPQDTSSSSSSMVTVLLDRLRTSRHTLESDLQKLYGPHYQDLFEPFDAQAKQRVGIGHHFLYKSPTQLSTDDQGFHRPTNSTTSSSSTGWNRLVRKLQIKLLHVLLQQDERRHLQQSQQQPPQSRITFSWVTTGNGQASGSGNLFHESYTSVLQSALAPIWQSVGMHFRARNHAISRLSSGDEYALCLPQLIGIDTQKQDVVFWDFEMTDEKDFWKLALFSHRMAHIQQSEMPALVAYHRLKEHTSLLAQLERKGMAVLGRDVTVQQTRQHAAIPDSTKLGNRALLSDHLKYLRCGKELEDGGPQVTKPGGAGVRKKLCRLYKFNTDVCPDRPHKYIWHPGWKFNALKGYTLALTMVELLQQALEQLAQHNQQQQTHMSNNDDWMQQHLKQLQQEELADAALFRAPTNIPTGVSSKWFHQEAEQQQVDGFLNTLFRQPAMCRTALLPSYSRFLDNKNKNMTLALVKKKKKNMVTTPYGDVYEQGVLFSKIKKYETDTTNQQNQQQTGGYRYAELERANDMVLVTEKADNYDCPQAPLAIDHQDAFMVTSAMGWRSLTIPAPTTTTNDNNNDNKGWLFMCLSVCDNSKCPTNDLHDRVCQKPFKKEENPTAMLRQYGTVEFQVNGIPVVDTSPLIHNKYSHLDNCRALHNNGTAYNYWQPDATGSYTLSARITGASKWSYLKISSVIAM
ncbi:expressed unknown protein [Seminavis robusta]|uniref:Uncharacterized protein n=1 Tax=Seminavis robusta TaxID=568900 RepID=A0A9N8DM87_9STRA|nr:expressed unknown protein [Seminavis robusta]|eukprot:Sro210_g087770.1 n/a (796) ;mRNA; f:82299-84686